MEEIWKQVPEFENYEVSNQGRVRRKKYTIVYSNNRVHNYDEKIKKQSTDKDGYKIVRLWDLREAKNIRVHRLVADVFLQNNFKKPQVNHKNGIKHDNRLENLEWCTLSENRAHAYNTGLQNGESREGEKNNFCKLNSEIVVSIFKSEGTYSSIAKEFNISRPMVSLIKRKKVWKHLF